MKRTKTVPRISTKRLDEAAGGVAFNPVALTRDVVPYDLDYDDYVEPAYPTYVQPTYGQPTYIPSTYGGAPSPYGYALPNTYVIDDVYDYPVYDQRYVVNNNPAAAILGAFAGVMGAIANNTRRY